ncbi:MAG: protein-export chaperone SecB [Betaproteobacteria bacterium TMED82]|nr:MAG: protein-export chaperone SecB [Betaproteobacteria bacterium TMED82]|tara:strand:- start:21845 stop:22333 length:489 start_codon:yes stop_codon:yes gene_type:complete
MAEENVKSEIDSEAPVFHLQRVYLKDLSVEIPHAPEIFLDNTPPKLEFQIDSEDKELENNMVEVAIKCTVTCKLKDKVGFLVESCEAGIFEIRNVEQEQRTLLKGITCPNIVYPYLRANIADILQRASFPPVHLTEINWELFYQEKMKKSESNGKNNNKIEN